MNGLRNNQYQAVTCSKENNFQSGVHFHATGTGKSWIALEIILEFMLDKRGYCAGILF